VLQGLVRTDDHTELPANLQVSSVPAILDLVAAGLGHAALGEDVLRAFEHPERLAVTRFKAGEVFQLRAVQLGVDMPTSLRSR